MAVNAIYEQVNQHMGYLLLYQLFLVLMFLSYWVCLVIVCGSQWTQNHIVEAKTNLYHKTLTQILKHS